MRETAIQSEILAALKQLPGVFVERMNTGMRGGVRFGTPGGPDLRLCVKGRAVGLEVKTEKTYQSADQVEWQFQFEAAGGIYSVVRSVDDALRVVMPLLK